MQHQGNLAHTPALPAETEVRELPADIRVEEPVGAAVALVELVGFASQQLVGVAVADSIQVATEQRIAAQLVLQFALRLAVPESQKSIALRPAVPEKLELMLPERWFPVEPQMPMSPE